MGILPAISDFGERCATNACFLFIDQQAAKPLVELPGWIRGEYPDQQGRHAFLYQSTCKRDDHAPADGASLICGKQVNGIDLTGVKNIPVALTPARDEPDNLSGLVFRD